MTPVSDEKAFLYTLIARAYYRLGDETNAVKYADLSLNLSSSFIKQVSYDGKNGVNNSMQGYVYGNPYGTAFQPLPRLDFLDPKYFQTDDPWNNVRFVLLRQKNRILSRLRPALLMVL